MTQFNYLGSEEELRKQNKDKGFSYQGKQIPLHSEDAMALLQVKAAFELGETSTVIRFSNGEKVTVTATTFAGFAALFVQARNAFYQD